MLCALASSTAFAGLTAPGYLTEMDYVDIERIFNVNLHGVFRTVQVKKALMEVECCLFPPNNTCIFLAACGQAHDGKADRQDCHPVKRQRLLCAAIQRSIFSKLSHTIVPASPTPLVKIEQALMPMLHHNSFTHVAHSMSCSLPLIPAAII